jgi:hypothetical protein
VETPDRDRPESDEEPEVAAALAFALAPERAHFDGAEPAPLPDPFVASPAEQEMGRLENRISELRIELARGAEERQRLAERLDESSAERDAARARIAELEALLARHEGRVVKAIRRLQGEDRQRERIRRALRIALHLLDDGSPETGAERERRPAEREEASGQRADDTGFTDSEPRSTPK